MYNHAFVYSLPDLKEIRRVFVGQHPEWITFTPDGKTVYFDAAGDNATYAVDTASMSVIAKIPTWQAPSAMARCSCRWIEDALFPPLLSYGMFIPTQYILPSLKYRSGNYT